MATRMVGENMLAGAESPEIFNLVLSEANTEYPQVLPTNCRKFSVQPRTLGVNFKLSFNPYESDTKYMTIRGCYSEDLVGCSYLVLYLQSPTAGAVVEILAWN